MLEVLKSQRLLLLKVLIALQISFLTFLFFRAVSDNRYYLAYEDEVINYCSAKVFSETGSVRAEGCITEDVSRIGQMNWYGPGYAVMYGASQDFFGEDPTLFIKIHFVLALLSITIIFFIPSSLESRLLFCSALLFTEQFTGYIFTYFPESIHLFFAIIFILLITLIYQAKDVRKRNLYVTIFIGLVFAVVLLRSTAIFWLTSLIGLSQTRKMMISMIIVFLVGLGITLLYMRYFTAPPYAGDMQKIDQLFEFDLFGFIFKTIKATMRNTFSLLKSGSFGVYILLLLMGIAMVRWWQTKERLLLAALLVSISLVGALMAYYSAGPWYFLKQSAILIPLIIFVLMVTNSPPMLKYGILMGGMLIFPLLYENISITILERQNAYNGWQNSKPFQSALNELTNHISEDSEVTVVWCYNEYDYGSAAEALLPFSTASGHPILYTTNIATAQDKPEVRFQLHHKLKVNYILSRYPLELPAVRLVHSTQFYHFYKIED